MYLSIYPSVCTFVFYCFILLALYISTKILSYSYGIYSIRKEQKVQKPELRCPYMRQGRGIRGTVIVLSEPLSPESKSLNAFLRTALHCPQVRCPQGSPVVTPVLIFLQCVFSHVSSKCLHRRMHSYTGCICLTQSVSPHCTALSKVGWPQGSPVVTPSPVTKPLRLPANNINTNINHIINTNTNTGQYHQYPIRVNEDNSPWKYCSVSRNRATFSYLLWKICSKHS